MKREIKFRGKKLYNGKWVCGYLSDVDSTPIGKVGIINSKPFSGCEDSTMVIAESIGQFTGLYDKNGVEIYEDDLLNVCVLPFSESETVTVKWNENEASYVLFIDEKSHSFYRFGNIMESEVIGNIYDNNY